MNFSVLIGKCCHDALSLYVVCENGDLKGQTTVKTAANNVPLRQHIESVLLIFPKICSKNDLNGG